MSNPNLILTRKRKEHLCLRNEQHFTTCYLLPDELSISSCNIWTCLVSIATQKIEAGFSNVLERSSSIMPTLMMMAFVFFRSLSHTLILLFFQTHVLRKSFIQWWPLPLSWHAMVRSGERKEEMAKWLTEKHEWSQNIICVWRRGCQCEKDVIAAGPNDSNRTSALDISSASAKQSKNGAREREMGERGDRVTRKEKLIS